MCCWPPDSSAGRCLARSPSPTDSSAARTSPLAGRRPASRSGSATLSSAVSEGSRLKDWSPQSAIQPDYANSCSGRVCMILETVGNGFFRVSAYTGDFLDFYGHYQLLRPNGTYINSPDGQQTPALSNEWHVVVSGTGTYCVVGWRLAHTNPNLYVNVGEPCNDAR